MNSWGLKSSVLSKCHVQVIRTTTKTFCLKTSRLFQCFKIRIERAVQRTDRLETNLTKAELISLLNKYPVWRRRKVASYDLNRLGRDISIIMKHFIWLMTCNALCINKKRFAIGLVISPEYVDAVIWRSRLHWPTFIIWSHNRYVNLLDAWKNVFILLASSVRRNVALSQDWKMHYTFLCLFGIMRIII